MNSKNEGLVPSSSALAPGAGANAPAPWYRQFWPWFLISWPLLAVIGGIITISIAINNPDGLVEDDYYKAGLAINQTLERKETAIKMGLQASGQITQADLQVTLKLTAKTTPLDEQRLLLKLVHPTASHRDMTVPLLRQADGNYQGILGAPPRTGDWHLILSPENNRWRLSARVNHLYDEWQLTP